MKREKGESGSHGSDGSGRSDGPAGSADAVRPALRPSGGYRQLRSFQVTTIIYDATVAFCERFVDKRSRTVDQMVQAARSGRQNIAEGSRASATSSQTELRLVSVARASLDELLLDYEDFLRQRGKRQWPKDDPEARAVRAVGSRSVPSKSPDPSDPSDPSAAPDAPAAAYSHWLTSPDPAVVANTIICLIHQANYLLDRQIAALEQQFVREGGYSERLAAARIADRAKQHQTGTPDPSHSSDPSDPSGQSKKPHPAPACPLCGKPMALRTARQGSRAGSQFWGCSAYPECKGTRQL
jgi:restriction system protein